MKIVYVHTTDLSKNDTSETFVVNNAISLAEEGIETHLFVTNRSAVAGLQILKEKFNLNTFPDQFHLHDFQLTGKSNWGFYRNVISVISQKEFEQAVIITRKHSMLPHLVFSKKPTQKLIFETHDFFYDLSIRKDIKKSSRRKQSLIEKIFLKRLDSIICLNKFQHELYSQHLKVPLKIFPTGFREPDVTEGDKENLLLYIGALEERKGINNLLNLAGLLDVDCKIMIIGSRNSEEVSILQKEIEDMNVAGKIELKEWLPKIELHQLLGKSKIGLLPLKEGYFNF